MTMASSTRAVSRARTEYRRTHGYSPSETYTVRTRTPQDARVIGAVDYIEYVTRKDFEGPKEYNFHHDWEGEKRPLLLFGEGLYILAGGGYKITPDGIEDDDTDRRSVPTGTSRMDLSVPRTVTGMGVLMAIGYTAQNGSRHVVYFPREDRVLAYTARGDRARMFIVERPDGRGREARN